MMLDATKVVTGWTELFDYGVAMGLCGLVIIGLISVIRILWNDRAKSRDAWLKTIDAKEDQITAKDQEIKEIRRDDRDMIKEVTRTIEKVNASIDNNIQTDKTLINQNHEILSILKAQK